MEENYCSIIKWLNRFLTVYEYLDSCTLKNRITKDILVKHIYKQLSGLLVLECRSDVSLYPIKRLRNSSSSILDLYCSHWRSRVELMLN